jgi:hypothetical protein
MGFYSLQGMWYHSVPRQVNALSGVDRIGSECLRSYKLGMARDPPPKKKE